MGEAYRDNHRISVTDPVLAQALWECGLDKIFSEFKIRGRVAVGLNPNIRFYRYVMFSEKLWDFPSLVLFSDHTARVNGLCYT